MSSHRRTFRAVVAPTLAVALFSLGWLSGCETLGLSTPRRSIGTETLDRIDKGSTRDEWVLAVMGQPTATARIGGGDTEIWKYPYKFEGKDAKRMILLGSRDDSTGERVIYVQLSNGVVTDWWRD